MQKEAVPVRPEASGAAPGEPVNELAARVDALAEAVRRRDHAMAVVAHDLRSPMEIISASTTLLLATLREPYARRHVERIERVTRRAASLVEYLLDVASVERGRLSLSKTRTDLSKTVAAVVDAARIVAEGRGIIVSNDLRAELPLQQIDEHRIEEVLQNLIDNAIKFTPAGGCVRVGAAARSDEIVVWVKDTGVGIPAAHLPHLFEAFWRGDAERWRGSGLGLSICKSIVDAHGGRIWVDSAVGQGTIVSFTLPAPGERAGGHASRD